MSVLESEQENAATETLPEETSAAESQNQTDAPPDAAEETFNPAQIEESFGLEQGELSGCKDMAEAMAAIQAKTDAALSAGLNYTPPVQQQQQAAPVQQQPFTATQQTTAEKVKKGEPNPEMEAMRAELAEIKGLLSQQTAAQQKHLQQQLDTRIATEIDSWKSPTYGVRGNRTFKQNKAAKELRELLETHCAGAMALGKSLPEVEYVLRQVRITHDEHFKTPITKAQPAPVGTPGSKKNMAAAKEAPNIHEALRRNAM